MKYWKLLTVSLLLVAMIALGTGMALAQDNDDPLPPAQGPGLGWGAAQGYGQTYGRGMMGNAWWLEVAAESLDISVDQLWSELSTGKSIAGLASERGLDVQTIVDDILAEHEALLNDAIAAGTITEEQKNWMQANMAAMISERVNEPWIFGGHSGWSGRGQGRGGRSHFGGGCFSGLNIGRSWSS